MGFLSKALSFGHKFIGGAHKVAKFIGSNIHHLVDATRTFQKFVNHPQVQSIGDDLGIPPSIFHKAGAIAQTVGNAAGLLPNVASGVSNAVSAGMNAFPDATKRSLADLYSQASSI